MPTTASTTQTSPRTLDLPALSPEQYQELQESIRLRGVLVPILRCEDGHVLDGRERLRAIEELGLRKWPERVIGGLTARERAEYRIRINCERRQLTREQRRQLVEQVVRALPSKSTRELADLCKVGKSTVARIKGTVPFGTVVVGINGKTYKPRPAVGVENRRQSEEAARLLADVGDDPRLNGGTGLRKLRQIRHQRSVLAHAQGPASRLPASIQIHHCDFRRLEEYSGDLTSSVDLALLDPPWSREWCRSNAGDLAAHAGRILRRGGIAAVYCGQASMPLILDAFRVHLNYHWQIVALNSIGKNGARKEGTVMSRYRPILIFIKGVGRLPRTISDVIDRGEEEDQMHPEGWGQPAAEAVRLVEALSVEGATVVDLTVGAGASAVAVAKVGGGRRFYGCDSSEYCVKIARRRVAEAVG